MQNPKILKQEMPKSAAEVYFLIGKCHVESGNYPSALDALNSAIRINPAYSEVIFLLQCFIIALPWPSQIGGCPKLKKREILLLYYYSYTIVYDFTARITIVILNILKYSRDDFISVLR